MKFSYNWLKDYVFIEKSPEELADKLTLAGFEVEGLEKKGSELEGIITGKIEKIEPHPNADKLVITQISDGKNLHQIVTGATNIKEGDIVPVSLPGAVLTGGFKIKEAKLRGVPSNGMLCSEKELGVLDEADGIWILPKETPLGVNFIDYGLLKDTILEISILPNRGDCQSIIGLAREIAVILDKPLQLPKIKIKTASEKNPVKVTVQDIDLCPKYTARALQNITIAPSPLWLQRRLQISGIRPINNVVDITNYVLLECGQPLHAFDYHLLKSPNIIVKRAEDGALFQTLDGVERTLDNNSLMICDEERAIALAGIMGGQNTEIQTDTKDVLLESAYFHPGNIRRTEVKTGLRTESSIRFQKGVDYNLVEFSADRAASLMQELAGATILKGLIKNELASDTIEQNQIIFNADQINELLGSTYPKAEMLKILEKLGFEINNAQTEVTVPSWRMLDIKEFPDLAEEIARIKGLDSIAVTLPKNQIAIAAESKLRTFQKKATTLLSTYGFNQINTFPMIAPEDIQKINLDITEELKLANPLTVNESVMRPHILPSLIKVLAYNIKRQTDDLKLFEIGKVFHTKNDEHTEEWILAGLLTGEISSKAYLQKDKENNQVNLFYVKGIIENILNELEIDILSFAKCQQNYLHPGQALSVYSNNKLIGECGLIHPKVAQEYDIEKEVVYFSLNLTQLESALEKPKLFKPFSKFPSTRRDLALLVPKTISYEEILMTLKQIKAKTVKEIFLFDAFESASLGENKKSLAFGFIYQNEERTLSDDEVNTAHERMMRLLTEKLPVTIR